MAKKRRKSMADSLEDDNLNVDLLSQKVKQLHSMGGNKSAVVESPKEEEKSKRFTFDIAESKHSNFKSHVAKHRTTMRERLIWLIEKDLAGEIE